MAKGESKTGNCRFCGQSSIIEGGADMTDSAAAGRSGNNAMHMRKGYGIPRNGEQKNRGKTESRRTVRKRRWRVCTAE